MCRWGLPGALVSEEPRLSVSIDRVTHCVCIGMTPLQELMSYQTYAEITEQTRCGTHCGLCAPFIRARLARRDREMKKTAGREISS